MLSRIWLMERLGNPGRRVGAELPPTSLGSISRLHPLALWVVGGGRHAGSGREIAATGHTGPLVTDSGAAAVPAAGHSGGRPFRRQAGTGIAPGRSWPLPVPCPHGCRPGHRERLPWPRRCILARHALPASVSGDMPSGIARQGARASSGFCRTVDDHPPPRPTPPGQAPAGRRPSVRETGGGGPAVTDMAVLDHGPAIRTAGGPPAGGGATGRDVITTTLPTPQSRPSHRPRQRVVSGDDFETSLPELEKHGGGVRVGPVVEGSVLFPGVQVHHGEFGLPGRHPAEVGGAGVTPLGARRAPQCSIAGGSAIGTAALPAPLHVAPSRRCILSLLATAVRLECGTGKAERRAVEGRGGSTPDTAPRGPSLGVFLPVTLLPPGPAGGARGPAWCGFNLAAAAAHPGFDPFPALALAADPGGPAA